MLQLINVIPLHLLLLRPNVGLLQIPSQMLLGKLNQVASWTGKHSRCLNEEKSPMACVDISGGSKKNHPVVHPLCSTN